MPLIRQIQTSALMPGATPHAAALVPQTAESGLIYAPYEYPYALAPAASIMEYPIDASGVLGKPLGLPLLGRMCKSSTRTCQLT